MMGWLGGGVMCKVARQQPLQIILYYKVLWQKPLQMAENHLNLPTQRPIFHPHTLLILLESSSSLFHLSISFTSSSGRYVLMLYLQMTENSPILVAEKYSSPHLQI